MREYAAPPTVPVPTAGNLTDDVVRHATQHPERTGFSRRQGDTWVDVTHHRFLEEVEALAKGLVAAGIEVGDRIGLMSKTRYEWTLFDYAIWFAGAVSVPIYETSSAEQVAWILADSGARATVCETRQHRDRIGEVRSGLPQLCEVWTLDDNAVLHLDERGREILDEEIEARRTSAGPDDVATIIYTSGTTGRPKGCALSHGNFEFELAVTTTELPDLFHNEDAATLLFLPLAHVLARIVQIGCMKAGARMGHSADVRHLIDDLVDFRPSFVLAVPRIFEKIFNTASQTAVADGRGRVFDRAARVAIAWSRALDGGRVPLRVQVQHRVFDQLVYVRLRGLLGGRCEHVISGGAPLGERLGHFYRGIGVTVLEGYGLTETTAAVTVNLPAAQKVGTVGRPIPGTAVRVGEDGELLFRGGQVFAGYWQDRAATAEVVDAEGWLHTGDLGEVDDEGFVRITGRKKEILVTAGGKNVAPGVLEDRLRAHALVDQCLVVGDGQPFIGALVTIDRDSFSEWARRHHKRGSLEAHVDDPDLREEIKAAVEDANKAVSRAESIRRFAILPDEWTEETGELTPSLKLKRAVVARRAREDIAALYVR